VAINRSGRKGVSMTDQPPAQDGRDDVLLHRDGNVSVVTFNKPDILNSIDARCGQALIERLHEADADPDTGAIVLTGAGRAFSAGGDIRNMGKPPLVERVNHRDWDLTYQILAIEKPLIAMVNGPAIGLGLTIALLCDCVYASLEAKLGDTHVLFGLVAGDGCAVTLPLLIGPHRAKELMMSGRLFTGAEAAQLGIVNHAVPADELTTQTLAFAHDLASKPAFAVRATKALINRHVRASAHEALDVGLAWERMSMRMPEHAEAVAARNKPKS
jgi:enoyl-CoA hydratase